MAKFIVLETFRDLEDSGKVYEVDSFYPKPSNKKISKERLQQLQGGANAVGRPLIEEIEEPQAESEKNN